MPMSPYVRAMRERIGHDLLLLQAVSVLLFDGGGRLLLARSAEADRWMTVGGAIDPDETPADAAVRETWEETGLLVEPVRILGVFGGPDYRVAYGNGDAVAYTVTAFEARILSGAARPDGHEVAELRYVTREDARSLPMGPHTRQIVDRAFERAAPAWFAPAVWTPPHGAGASP